MRVSASEDRRIVGIVSIVDHNLGVSSMQLSTNDDQTPLFVSTRSAFCRGCAQFLGPQTNKHVKTGELIGLDGSELIITGGCSGLSITETGKRAVSRQVAGEPIPAFLA